MKAFLSLLLILSTFTGFTQKDTTMLVASDNNVTWTVFLTRVAGNEFNLQALARPADGKELSGVAALTVDNTYGVTVDPKTTKESGNNGQISLTRKLFISKKDRYVIAGSTSWYMKGEKDVKKKYFRLVFTND